MAGFRLPMPTRGSSSGSYRGGASRGLFGSGGSGGLKMRLIIAVGIALFALMSYYGSPGDENKVTGNRERVAYADEVQEMQLGLQVMPQMVAQHGGESRDPGATQMVNRVGFRLLQALQDNLAENGRELPYEFDFHLLADRRTVNAFALPGGQIFITEALFAALETEGQLAGVLGHEIGHVIERHGNKRMAQEQLFTGLATAAGTVGGDASSMQMAQMAKQMISMKYGREDELESDKWGVRLLALADYDPRAMIGVMKVLEEAAGSGGPPEMMSTHPKPANRVKYIEDVLQLEFPDGVPDGQP
jgi:predicted Zn-dependent protease